MANNMRVAYKNSPTYLEYNSTEASPLWGRASMCTQLKQNILPTENTESKRKQPLSPEE